MEDTIHHKDLRARLMTGLRNKGIKNEDVLTALERVPRHLFVDGDLSPSRLYEDVPLAIGHEQTISQPYTVAFQTELLEVNREDRVLEIGTGSGYQAAVLFELGAEIYSVERQQALFIKTSRRLKDLGYGGIHVFYGDGGEGLPQFAPFSKILVTAEAQEVPDKLLQQLVPGGILVAPVAGSMRKIIKLSDREVQVQDHGQFIFVPMLRGTQEDKSRESSE